MEEDNLEAQAKEATEQIQAAAEAADDEETKARLVEARKEVARAALEEVGTSFLTAD